MPIIFTWGGYAWCTHVRRGCARYTYIRRGCSNYYMHNRRGYAQSVLESCHNYIAFSSSGFFAKENGEEGHGDEEWGGGGGMRRGRSFSSYMGGTWLLVKL